MLPIALLTYSTKPRGSVVHAACLAEALTGLGLDVTLCALAKPGDGFFRDVSCTLHLLPAATAPLDGEMLIRQRIAEMAEGLRTLAPRRTIFHSEDCLSANGLEAARHALAPAAVLRTVHHVEDFASSPYLAACQRRSVLAADSVLVVSPMTQREVRAEFARSAKVISNGVVLERFQRQDGAREDELRARFGIGPDTLVVLSVGGVEERKNTLRSLEAIASAFTRVPNLVWFVVGAQSIFDHAACERAFDKRLSELPPEIRQRIFRLGTVAEADLTALYRVSDVLLSPSLKEGFGLSVLEAIAADTAVVVSDRDPFRSWLTADTACFVDPTSSASIGSGLSRLLLDATERRRLANAGRALSERFSWRRVAEAHIAEYERVLDSRTRARAPHPAC